MKHFYLKINKGLFRNVNKKGLIWLIFFLIFIGGVCYTVKTYNYPINEWEREEKNINVKVLRAEKENIKVDGSKGTVSTETKYVLLCKNKENNHQFELNVTLSTYHKVVSDGVKDLSFNLTNEKMGLTNPHNGITTGGLVMLLMLYLIAGGFMVGLICIEMD